MPQPDETTSPPATSAAPSPPPPLRPRIGSSKKSQFYGLASFAIVLALLYFGREVLIPLALAVLIAFLLTPVANALERLRLGRVASALIVAIVGLALLGGFGWVVERRLVEIVNRLPDYRQSVQAKFHRLTRLGGVVEKVRREFRQTVQDPPATQAMSATTRTTTAQAAIIELAPTASARAPQVPEAPPAPLAAAPASLPPPPVALVAPSPDAPWAVRLYPQPATALELAGEYLGRILTPVATAGLVLVFIIFMLIGRDNLRDRMILLAGGGRLHVTTQAFDDAATRISRFLTAQSLINLAYGIVVALGLWVIDMTLGGGHGGGIRTALLAGMICAVTRFVPYIGPWLGAAVPLGLAFAAFPGNGVFFATLAMFVAVEIFVSQAVEPNVLGSSTGVSPIAVLISAVFWTWLWGPIGLLLSTPLTVLLVVIGKYVPQFAMLDVLLGDKPVLDATTRVYQRLIAGDDEEAAEIALEYLGERPLEAVYDEILIPVLAEAECDWHHGKLDDVRHARIRQAIRDIVGVLGDQQHEEDARAAATTTVRQAKGLPEVTLTSVPADTVPTAAAPAPAPAAVSASPAPTSMSATRPPLPASAVVRVRCLPAHDEADQIVCLMLAQVLERRRFRVSVPDTVALASETAASIDPATSDVVVVSALPPKAALHARYLVRLFRQHDVSVPTVVALWTAHQTGAVAPGGVPTVTSLDALQDQLDQVTPMILLKQKPSPVPVPGTPCRPDPRWP
jgi:predicted PurR-regulated permease PerM